MKRKECALMETQRKRKFSMFSLPSSVHLKSIVVKVPDNMKIMKFFFRMKKNMRENL